MARHRRRPDPQTLRPRIGTMRSVIVAIIGPIPLLPDIARAAHVDTVPAIAATLAVVAAIDRVLALPAVDDWLDRHLPALSTITRSTDDAPS